MTAVRKSMPVASVEMRATPSCMYSVEMISWTVRWVWIKLRGRTGEPVVIIPVRVLPSDPVSSDPVSRLLLVSTRPCSADDHARTLFSTTRLASALLLVHLYRHVWLATLRDVTRCHGYRTADAGELCIHWSIHSFIHSFIQLFL